MWVERRAQLVHTVRRYKQVYHYRRVAKNVLLYSLYLAQSPLTFNKNNKPILESIPNCRVAYCALCIVTNDLNLLHISTVEKKETRFKKVIKKEIIQK